jgi:hypothetical protein
MRTIHPRARAGVSVAVAMAFMAIASGPAVAQQPSEAAAVQDSTPLTLMFVVFPDSASASAAASGLTGSPGYQAMSSDTGQSPQQVDLGADSVHWIEPYYAVASMDKNGKVTVKDQGNKGHGARDTRAEQSIDGVTALLEERPSQPNQPSDNGQAAGAGASRGGVSSANLKDMQSALQPGQTALIFVVAQPAADAVASQMKQANASDVVDAPLIIVAPE